MNNRRNFAAYTACAAADTTSIVAEFALEMLASAHRTGMDTLSITYETLRFNAIARIEDAMDALDLVNRTEAVAALVDRYNEIIES